MIKSISIIVLSGLLLVAGFFLPDWLAKPNDFGVLCAIEKHPCSSQDGQQQLTLQATDNNSYQVTLSSSQPLSSPIVTVRGVDMFMGESKVVLKDIGNNSYQGELLLPYCGESQMQWAGLVQGLPQPLGFTFNSHGDKPSSSQIHLANRHLLDNHAQPQPLLHPEKLTLLYFGAIRSVLSENSLSKLANVLITQPQLHAHYQTLIISVDPDNDQQQWAEYVSSFAPQLQPRLPQDAQQLRTLADELGVFYQVQPHQLQHNDFIYLLGSDGRLLNLVDMGQVDAQNLTFILQLPLSRIGD